MSSVPDQGVSLPHISITLPSRSKTSTGMLPRLKTNTLSDESTATAVASCSQMPCGTLPQNGTGSNRVAGVTGVGMDSDATGTAGRRAQSPRLFNLRPEDAQFRHDIPDLGPVFDVCPVQR